MHPTDEHLLQLMLGQTSIPQDLEHEVNIRTRLLHLAGPTGACGPFVLLDALRFCGYAPKKMVDELPVVVDWRQYPQDGRTKVEARRMGVWLTGTFRGFVEHGSLAIKLDDDGSVQEFPAKRVKLVELLEELPRDREEKPVPAEAATEHEDAPPEPPPVEDRGEVLEAPDWAKLPGGTPVYAETEGDFADAVFQGVVGEGESLRLLVQVGDKTVELEPDRVTYAGD